MNTPEPTPQPDMDFSVTEEQFEEALKNPAFVAELHKQYRKMLNGDFGEIEPEARESIARALEGHSLQLKTMAIHAKFAELKALIQRPGGAMLAEDRLASAKRIFDDVTDLALELPEPHRTDILRKIVPLRAQVHGLKMDG